MKTDEFLEVSLVHTKKILNTFWMRVIIKTTVIHLQR